MNGCCVQLPVPSEQTWVCCFTVYWISEMNSLGSSWVQRWLADVVSEQKVPESAVTALLQFHLFQEVRTNTWSVDLKVFLTEHCFLFNRTQNRPSSQTAEMENTADKRRRPLATRPLPAYVYLTPWVIKHWVTCIAALVWRHVTSPPERRLVLDGFQHAHWAGQTGRRPKITARYYKSLTSGTQFLWRVILQVTSGALVVEIPGKTEN